MTATNTLEVNGCACQIEHVLIISIDGLRPDALELADTPTLDALRAAGAYSNSAQAVLPSVTLVNHASMLGGMGPEKHGIIWNEMDLERGMVKGPTVFSVAHEAGLSTAMIAGKPKLEQLVLPDSVDLYYYAGYTDTQVVLQALEVIQAGLPDILFIHLPDVDSAGHLTGWMSTAQLLAVNLTDNLIGRVVAALETEGYLETTLILITADHGGSGFRHGSDSPEDTTIPWLAVGPGVSKGLVLEREIMIYDTAATALYALNLPIPEIWDGKPVLDIFE
jgi:predicted AlkP superfamily pyrophosphatase or phosphodiesterase